MVRSSLMLVEINNASKTKNKKHETENDDAVAAQGLLLLQSHHLRPGPSLLPGSVNFMQCFSLSRRLFVRFLDQID